MNLLAGGSEMHRFGCSENELFLLVMNLIRKFYPPRRTGDDFRMRTRLTTQPWLPPLKAFEFLRCEADDYCLSKLMLPILKVFPCQDSQRWLGHQKKRGDTRSSQALRTWNDICRSAPTEERIENITGTSCCSDLTKPYRLLLLSKYFANIYTFLHEKHL